MSPAIATPFIVVHVLTAIASIIVGIFAMRTNNNIKRHGQIGRAYGVIMGISLVTAIVLLFGYRFNFFLMLVTLLSSQSLIVGYRSAKRKNSKKVNWLDWGVVAVTGGYCVGYLLWTAGVVSGLLSTQMPTAFIFVGLGFCFLIGSGVRETVGMYLNPPSDRRAWLYFHFEQMLGSYVALCTAFSISTAGFILPAHMHWIAWAATPTIGGFLIARYSKQYRARFAPKAASVSAD